MAIVILLAKRLHEMAQKIELKDGYALHVNLTFTADEETYAHNKVKVEYAVYAPYIVDTCRTTRYYSVDTNLTNLLSGIKDDIKSSIKQYLKPERMTLSEIIERLKNFLGDDVWYDGFDDKICDFCGEWISFYPLKGKISFTEEDYDKISDFLLTDKGERFLIDRHFKQFMDYMECFKGAKVIWWKDEKVGLDLPLENNGKCFMSTFDLTAFGDVRSLLNWYEKRFPLKENFDIGLQELEDDDFQFEDDFS